MNIRFTSSLTPEDENTLAPAILKALSSILDLLPIAYLIRIDTSDSQVYQQRSAEPGDASTHGAPRPQASAPGSYGSLELR